MSHTHPLNEEEYIKLLRLIPDFDLRYETIRTAYHREDTHKTRTPWMTIAGNQKPPWMESDQWIKLLTFHRKQLKAVAVEVRAGKYPPPR